MTIAANCKSTIKPTLHLPSVESELNFSIDEAYRRLACSGQSLGGGNLSRLLSDVLRGRGPCGIGGGIAVVASLSLQSQSEEVDDANCQHARPASHAARHTATTWPTKGWRRVAADDDGSDHNGASFAISTSYRLIRLARCSMAFLFQSTAGIYNERIYTVRLYTLFKKLVNTSRLNPVDSSTLAICAVISS